MLPAAVTGLGWGDLVIGAAALLVSVVFGYPAWRLARATQHTDEVRNTARAVADYLGLPDPGDNRPIPGPDPEHPSILDLLMEIRDTAQEQAALSTVIAYHLSDDHGGKIPAWLEARPVTHRWQKTPPWKER